MTARDLRVIEFLTEFKLARTSTIANLFFGGNKRVAQRRLKVLSDSKEIKRIFEGEYIYYSTLPTQYLHALTLTDYIAFLAKKYNVDLSTSKAEYMCGKTRADALLTLNGRPCFIEVQLTDMADIKKYVNLKVSGEWEKTFSVFPSIRILGNAPQSNRLGIDIYVDDPKQCIR
jgi:hypothetical protein